MARFEKELTEARDRNTEYLEALQSVEGRRSVFEDLISTLEDDVSQRDARIAAAREAASADIPATRVSWSRSCASGSPVSRLSTNK